MTSRPESRAAERQDMTLAPVAILFAESLAGIEVSWSLLDAGHPVIAVTRRGSSAALRRSNLVRVVEIAAPEDALDQSLEELRQLASRIASLIMMPLEDVAVSMCARAFTGSSTRVAGPMGSRARLALDKRLQLEAAGRAGLGVPATWHFDAAAQALELSEFPIVLKPRCPVVEYRGRLSGGPAYICADGLQLERAVQAWPRHHPLIAQRFLPGTGEGLFGLVANGHVHAWSAHRRVRMMNPRGSGSSACVAISVDQDIQPRVEQVLQGIRWEGIFMVELLRDDSGFLWFMELNGRAWGSMALARRMGFEYPAWQVALTVDPSFRPQVPAPAPPLICRHLGRELVHVAKVFRGRESQALATWPSRRRTLRNMLCVSRRQRLYNWRKGELSVFVSDTVSTLHKQLLGRKERHR